jgi:hypothetical protein
MQQAHVRCPWDDDSRPGPAVERFVVKSVRYFTGGDVLWPYCSVHLVKQKEETGIYKSQNAAEAHVEGNDARHLTSEEAAMNGQNENHQAQRRDSHPDQETQGASSNGSESANGSDHRVAGFQATNQATSDSCNDSSAATAVRTSGINGVLPSSFAADTEMYVTLHGGNELPEFLIDDKMFEGCLVSV